ncbi:hypothetical protein MKK84_31220 [Methylobacterium sp. E-065]|nr:hypothetical protein [Methylobacterium sp. E-065]
MGCQLSGFDPAVECYRSLIGETEADTCCKRICVIIRRMRDDPSCPSHQLHFMVLANQLMSETKTFGRYIVEMDARISEGDYITAILIGDAMIKHETMLHQIAAGKPLQYGALIN